MSEPSERWQPNNREVSAKVIDGEAIIIRLSDGIYYSMDGVGASVWSMIEEGQPVDDIVAAVAHRFDVSADRAREDVARLLDELRSERLIASADDGTPRSTDGGLTNATGPRESYAPPVLNIYRDMGELLALDPPAPGLLDIDWSEKN